MLLTAMEQSLVRIRNFPSPTEKSVRSWVGFHLMGYLQLSKVEVLDPGILPPSSSAIHNHQAKNAKFITWRKFYHLLYTFGNWLL